MIGARLSQIDPGLLYLPSAGVSAGGGVGVSLKPGIVNTIPITKKTYGGAEPWVWVSHQRIKIDGCGPVLHPFVRHSEQVDRRG